MRVLVLGADGYLGWPTALRFAANGHRVEGLDNGNRRKWHRDQGSDSLVPIAAFEERCDLAEDKGIILYRGDVLDYRVLKKNIAEFRPDVIVHYAEQPSAPFSMIDHAHAQLTQRNNVIGTLNVLFAMQAEAPSAHLIKLGSMGEYGTPNIDIEEGVLEIHYRGRFDRLPYPKQPGSFYHASKVHDSTNIAFACKIWGLRATDINQGVVYGLDTEETAAYGPTYATRFDYDQYFGTVLNRFLVQSIAGIPLTVYGKGGQTRGFLDIRDTVRCVELAALNPPAEGEYRVFNQFTEQFKVRDLAVMVRTAGAPLGLQVQISEIPNPRIEAETHYYNAAHQKLLDLGLKPHLLTVETLRGMLQKLSPHIDRVRHDSIQPETKWRQR